MQLKSIITNLKHKGNKLQYLLFIPVLIVAILVSFSFNNILNIYNKQIEIVEAKNISYSTKMAVPKYNVESPTTEVVIPKIIVAPINDKEDAQKRKNDDSKPSDINDAKGFITQGKSLGIDVSKWQGNINWTSVKNSGVEFAIIRVGYRGSVTGQIVMDPYFYQNVEGALKNGIHVGIYFFSMARNEIEAREEALWTVNAIKKYRINYPVAFDLESFGQDRLAGVSNEQLNRNANAFLSQIQSSGYQAMHYGSKSTFGPIWNMSNLNNYKIWLAHYTNNGVQSSYTGKYNMWQYTSKGTVPGINGYVDMNIAYFKLSSNANDQTNKDQEISKDPNKDIIDNMMFDNVNEQVTTTANVYIRKSPTTSFENKIELLKEKTILTRTGISKEGWSRVNYNNTVGYISTDYLEIIIN